MGLLLSRSFYLQYIEKDYLNTEGEKRHIKLERIASNTLSDRDIQFIDKSAATVMMVAGGYPDVYEKGKQIYGLNSVVDSLVFHAGTIADGPSVLTSGGRVLAVTSYGKNIEVAIEKAYEAVSKISFEGAYYRKDLGQDVLSQK